MKYRKRLVSFLTVICCLVGSLMPVQVSAAEAEEIPRVVFENEQNVSPDLYVTKKVQSTSGSSEVQDDLKFTFVLRLDGKLAKELEYRVFDADGNEVFNTVSSGSGVNPDSGIRIPFRTDRSGTFTLKPGQTAKFEGVGAGVSYEVSERSQEGWQQIQPAGGAPATGVVTDKGAVAEFTNMTGGEEACLIVQKTVSFPAGYELPETPEFTFVLELERSRCVREPYILTDLESGLEIDTGMTDEQGRFTLKGGQAARFDELPLNMDYKVWEVTDKPSDDTVPDDTVSDGTMPEGWWATGETEKEGSTGNGNTVLVNLNNANTSFAVTKKLEDDSKPEEEFTFLLTHEDRSVWAGAAYLLYETGGEPVTDENGDPIAGKTNDEGYFILQPGQAAIFTGIEPGTVYNVSEVGRPDYIQIVPGTAEGYPDKVVSEAVEVLPFVNRPADGGLTVTKVLENINGEAPMKQKEFTFILRKMDVNGVYQPLADAVYSIEVGGFQYTYKTNEKGEFKLKSNETARFTGLENGNYQVEEMDSGLEYVPDKRIQDGTISDTEKNFAFTFINKYNARLFDLYLVKKNHKDEKLSGAEFMLYRDELLKNPVQDTPYRTEDDGKITITDLKTGTYYLVETQSPEGYQLLANLVKIDVSWEGTVMKVSVDGKEVTSNTSDEQIYIVHKDSSGSGKDEVHITIYNSRNFSLPATGGGGVLMIGALLGGILLLIFAMWRMGSKER